MGRLASGRIRALSATSDQSSAIETMYQARLATGSGTPPAGIASTAKAGRYLNW